MEGASVILGSATRRWKVTNMRWKESTGYGSLTKRAQNAVLPQVYIEDLRAELRAGNRSIFSRRLRSLMEDRLNKGEQMMLFLNRRGYAGFVSCRSCGHVMECPHCDVSMTYHREGVLKCHYCGYEQPRVTRCPVCGSKYISGFRAGTQQIEEAVKKSVSAGAGFAHGYGYHGRQGRP